MEIKCDICGTINDGSTNFCKGCFQKLNAERKQNVVTEEPDVVSVIENEDTQDIPWNNDVEVENAVENPTPEIDSWETTSVNGEVKSVVEEPAEEVFAETTEEVPVEETTEEVQGEQPAEEIPVGTNVEEVAAITEEIPTEVTEEEIPAEEPIAEPPAPEVLEEVAETAEEVPVEETLEDIQEEQPIVENIELSQDIPEDTDSVNEISESESSTENDEKIIEEEIPVEETDSDIHTEDSAESVAPAVLETPIPEVGDSQEEIIEPISELGEEPTKTKEVVDDWSKEPVEDTEEVKKEPKYVLKFALVYLISMVVVFGTLILTTKYLNKVFDNVTSEIVSFAIYRLAALLTLIISTFITFRKSAPKIEKMNSVTFKILGFIALPSILIQLFVLGFIKDTKVLMFIVGIMLSLIVLVIFFSYIRNTIKKKNETKIDDKVFFVYGIINIIIIIGLLGFGIYARSHNLDMPKINFLYSIFNDTEEDKNMIQSFIDQVQLKIIENQSTIENYQFPKVINDVEYATYEGQVPDSINLNLNNEGAIIGGTVEYHGIIYTYDGVNIEVK